MNNIFLNKKQLTILWISLMSLTRDELAFNFGIENGAFTEDDIYNYIETLDQMIKDIENGNGAILTTEVDYENFETFSKDFYDLWGNQIG